MRRQFIKCDNPECPTKSERYEKVLLMDYLPKGWYAIGFVSSKEDNVAGGKFVETHEFCGTKCLDAFMKPSMDSAKETSVGEL